MNRENYKKNIVISNLALAALLYSIGKLVFTIKPEFGFTMFPTIPAFFFLLTLLILISITKAAIVDARKFHMKYLITRTVKLILLVAFCLVYVMCNGENNISFISSVVVCYLCYTVYEAFILKKFNDMLSKENSEVE